MNYSVMYLGRVTYSTVGCIYTPRVLKVDENWFFPIVIYPYSDDRVYTKPREKSGRVSLVPEDIHDRQLYILNKI
jgi:hypothetical protein